MGFGAGTLLSAVAHELVPEASFQHGLGVGIGFLVGALTYYVGDRLVDQAGGAQRRVRRRRRARLRAGRRARSRGPLPRPSAS